MTTVGVLAPQGDGAEHCAQLHALGAAPREVRRRSDLDGLTHLVLPGGESTTLAHLMRLFELWDPVIELHREGALALFGTCAGAILLGRGPGATPQRMELLDAVVRRNAYGRQLDSFCRAVETDGLGTLPGVFIRAPRFTELGPGVRAIGSCGGETVLVEADGLLAATFHAELAGCASLHRYFLDAVPPAGGAVTASRDSGARPR